MISKPAPEEILKELNQYVSVSHEAFERLSIYHHLLVKWQDKINLISSNSSADIWRRHFLDSLQLIKAIPDRLDVILDIGSGAGFPGMVLAIMKVENVHLVERDIRKIAFLREIARATNTKISIHQGEIEKQPLLYPQIITARACAPLGTLLDLIAGQVSHGTICLFPKGKNWSKEIEDAKKNWVFEYTAIPSVTDNEGVILKLTHMRKRKP